MGACVQCGTHGHTAHTAEHISRKPAMSLPKVQREIVATHPGDRPHRNDTISVRPSWVTDERWSVHSTQTATITASFPTTRCHERPGEWHRHTRVALQNRSEVLLRWSPLGETTVNRLSRLSSVMHHPSMIDRARGGTKHDGRQHRHTDNLKTETGLSATRAVGMWGDDDARRKG